MKKITMALTLAAAWTASSAHALLDASIFGGYTTLAMGDYNEDLDSTATLRQLLVSSDATNKKLSGGFYTGVDLAFTVMPFLKIGPRVEYIQGSVANSYTLNASEKNTINTLASIMPVMIGLSADMGLPLSDLSFRAGVYGGYGMAKLNTVAEGGGSRLTTDLSGSGFVAEVDAQLRYKIIPLISLGLDLGYRLANISQMNDDKTGIASKKSATENMTYDFSGLNAGLALAFNF